MMNLIVIHIHVYAQTTSKISYINLYTYCMALAGREAMRGRKHGNVAMHINSLLLLLETAKSTIYRYGVGKYKHKKSITALSDRV